MKKLMIATGAAALFATFSFSALAEDATGTIASIDSAAGLVTLNDGKVFKLPTTVALATFMSGQNVKVTFAGNGPGFHFTKDDPAPATDITLVTTEGAAPAPGAAR